MKPEKKQSPHLFCLRYGSGCLEARRERGEVTDREYEALMDALRHNREPGPETVRTCFPRVYTTLGANPTLREMQRYWRHTHRTPEERTPVYLATVLLPGRIQLFWEVRYYDPATGRMRKTVVHNVCNLPLARGTQVFIHGTVIAELVLTEA